MTPPPRVVIAIPTYSGLVPEHVASLLALQAHLQGLGVPVRILQHNRTEISQARNVLASLFLEIEDGTHLLFIDSDIEFTPDVVETLISANQPIVGCAYPKRQLDFQRLINAARRLTDPAQIVASAMDFVVVPDGPSAKIENGLCRVAGLGMGLCLIRREVLTSLLATGRLREGPGVLATKGAVYGFFDPIETNSGLLSEDLSFCERWRSLCGGVIWALVDKPIGHVGTMNFRARLLDALIAGSIST